MLYCNVINPWKEKQELYLCGIIMVKKIITYCLIIFGALLCAVNYQLFVFPNSFAPAGLNGICTMIQHIFGVSIGYLNLLINVPLAVAVFLLVGREWAIRSMIYTVAFSVFTLLLEKVDLSAFAYATENGTSTILGPLTAGLITGWIAGILFRANACTGGTEFVASLIHRYHPHVNFFWVTFMLNVVVAAGSYFVYDFKVEPVLLCIIYSFASSSVRDRMTQTSRSAVRYEIITDEPEQIGQEIIHRLHHSATVIPAKGLYKGKETNMLVCIVNRSQAAEMTAILRNCPHSFVSMSLVSEVYGNFKRLDRHGKPEKQLIDIGE